MSSFIWFAVIDPGHEIFTPLGYLIWSSWKWDVGSTVTGINLFVSLIKSRPSSCFLCQYLKTWKEIPDSSQIVCLVLSLFRHRSIMANISDSFFLLIPMKAKVGHPKLLCNMYFAVWLGYSSCSSPLLSFSIFSDQVLFLFFYFFFTMVVSVYPTPIWKDPSEAIAVGSW